MDIEKIGHERRFEVAMSLTETSSKIYKLQLYNKVANNLIHRRRYYEAIENKLQNLENHQI